MEEQSIDFKKYKSQYLDYIQHRDEVIKKILKTPYEHILIIGSMHAHGSYNLGIKLENPEKDEHEKEIRGLKSRYDSFFEELLKEVKKEVKRKNIKPRLEQELAYLDIFNEITRRNIPIWITSGGMVGFLNHTSYPLRKFAKQVGDYLEKNKKRFLLDNFLKNYHVVIGESLLTGDHLSIEVFLDKKERARLNRKHGPGTHYDRVCELLNELRSKGVRERGPLGVLHGY